MRLPNLSVPCFSWQEEEQGLPRNVPKAQGPQWLSRGIQGLGTRSSRSERINRRKMEKRKTSAGEGESSPPSKGRGESGKHHGEQCALHAPVHSQQHTGRPGAEKGRLSS